MGRPTWWRGAQALLALREDYARTSLRLHAAAVTAVLCLSRGCSPSHLAAALRLTDSPAVLQLDMRSADIQSVAQLAWEGSSPQQCALAAAQARNPLSQGGLLTCNPLARVKACSHAAAHSHP